MPGPRDSDWVALRETIIKLYWTDNKPLPEVVQTMRSEHEFFATYALFGPIIYNSQVN